MPFTVPSASAYQGSLFPVRGNWHYKPPEGDKVIGIEIDWSSYTTDAVAIDLSGNSPVSFSRIVALDVDNSANGLPVLFIFPDTGSSLPVPAYSSGVFPVNTNAQSFYAQCTGGVAAAGKTLVQIMNSMPPPVALAPTYTQSFLGGALLPLDVAGTAQLVPVGVNGGLQAFDVSGTIIVGAGTGNVRLSLTDGNARVLWGTNLGGATTDVVNFNLPVTGINARFANGMIMHANAPVNIAAGSVALINVYLGVP